MQISKFMLFQVWKKPFQNHLFGAREHMPQIYKKTKHEQQTKNISSKQTNFLAGATTITLLNQGHYGKLNMKCKMNFRMVVHTLQC